MEAIKEVIAFIIAHHVIIVESLIAILSGVVALALLIPGDQPEKALQKIIDLLKKISVKKKV